MGSPLLCSGECEVLNFAKGSAPDGEELPENQHY